MPKAFISYCWGPPSHQARILEWAERLTADGIEVVLDVYDFREGHDKFAFMERMIADDSVTHVLVFTDKEYAAKADARKAGVGTESQIISKTIYEKTEQSKFIPLICEIDSSGEPYLPIFLQSRKYIDFSSPQRVNENWEKLIRVLYGRPLVQRPALGQPPAYIREDDRTPASPATAKFQSLKQAILDDKKGIRLYRNDFLDASIAFADALRVRERPDVPNFPQKVLEDCNKLVAVRNQLTDWVLLESETNSPSDFGEALIAVLERLNELKSRPSELNQWNDSWFEAHKLFVYETFLYVVAALLKTDSFGVLHNMFTTHYAVPASERVGKRNFERFDTFYAYAESLNSVLAPEGKNLLSPAAALSKRQASRQDISFDQLIEADLLTLLLAFVTPDTRWYPQTFYYATYSQQFPLFYRAAQHKNFIKLATITGVDTADKLRQKVLEGKERLGVATWHHFHHSIRSFDEAMNTSEWDTIS